VPVITTENLRLPKGSRLVLVDPEPSYFDYFLTPDRAGILYEGLFIPGPDFVNGGLVAVLSEFSQLSGFAVARTTGPGPGRFFQNEASGVLQVVSTAPWLSAAPTHTRGYFAPQLAIDVINEGLIQVASSSAETTGVEAWDSTMHFTNEGSIQAIGDHDAYGLLLGNNGLFQNRGLIDVAARQFAVGFYIGTDSVASTGDDVFNNRGVILATSTEDISFGVFVAANFHEEAYHNSGIIAADVAFRINPGVGLATVAQTVEHLYNSGEIHGDIGLAYGADELLNKGVISGHTDLGGGFDLYDGSAGLHFGLVDGGAGDDRLLGGLGSESLFGGVGSDRLYGGDGDDALEGGRGSDSLDGGAGFDTVSYLYAWGPVTVDLGAGTAVGEGRDSIRNVEAVLGSSYHDTITGTGADDLLEGAAGDDQISAGAGADILFGDSGDDTLTGGGGGDVFVFSTGDGFDTITDFNPLEDLLELHGFTSVLSVQQAGADTLITLSPFQTVLLQGVQASSVTGAAFTFDAIPLAPTPLPPLPGTQYGEDGEFRIYAGEVLHIVDPGLSFAGDFLQRNTAVHMGTELGTQSSIVAGALRLDVSAATGIAKGFFLPFEVTVLATGSLEVTTTNGASAVGIFAGNLLNAGHVRVVANHGLAPTNDDVDWAFPRPEVGQSTAVGVFSDRGTAIINTGTVEVSSGRVSSGFLLYNYGTDRGFWNSGSIEVAGAFASTGVLFQGQVHPALFARPTFVNSGLLTVVDTSAAVDSVGLRIAVTGAGAKVWNSGVIEADYAIKWHVAITPDSGGNTTIYNSGELRGLVDLSVGAESFYNRGLVTGRIELHGGNDLFDGRGGTQAAGVAGGAGNDTLYGGDGIDTIDGGADDDLIAGGAGNDLLTGGAGNDTFHVEAGFGADIVTDFTAGTGQDSIRVSGYANFQSVQQQGADTLVTFSASDTILLRNVNAASLTALDFSFSAAPLAAATIPDAPGQPASLDFTLPYDLPPAFATPGAGFDAPVSLAGTAGADALNGGTGTDSLSGNGGDDLLTGHAGDDLLTGEAGDDELFGGLGDDDLHGGGDDDRLLGLSGADALWGDEGEDILIGGGDADTMDGGAGADLFVYQFATDSSAAHLDRIANFESGIDRIDLRLLAPSDIGWTAHAGYSLVTAETSYGPLTFRVDGALAMSDFLIRPSDAALVGALGDDHLVAPGAGYWLFGMSGDDTLDGTGGADTLDGGYDADLMRGGDGDDIYYVDHAADQVIEAEDGGIDEIRARMASFALVGLEVENLTAVNYFGAVPIVLVGNAMNNVIRTMIADTLIDGGAGDDSLFGGEFYDVLTGGSGADALDGGNGLDTASHAGELGGVFADLRTGRGYGNAAEGDTYTSIENLIGSEAADVLVGKDGANRLDGGGGDDSLVGGIGADALVGGAGIDTAGYDDNWGAVFVNLNIGQGFGNAAQGDTYQGIENVLGTAFADFIIGDSGANRLDGAAGADILVGSAGGDFLVGGAGIDTASYEDNWGGVFVNLNIGQGFGNAAQGDTYDGIENVNGSIFDDFFIGDSGVNRLDGGAGADILVGSVGGDALIGGGGIDTASYEDNWGAVFVNLTTGQGFGNAADGDSYDGVENLNGSIFDDFFIGDGGANRLAGRLGADTLVGAGGADSFLFDTALGGTNVDLIHDFVAADDTILLDDAVFAGLALGALAAGAFATGATAGDLDDRIVYNQATGALLFDADGSGVGAAVQFATLQGTPVLTASDFMVL
jgi:Ca2+-binding RTX toxin-like protein